MYHHWSPNSGSRSQVASTWDNKRSESGVWGVKDFAGGIVVHTTAGFGALASVFVVGNRKPAEGESHEALDTPGSIPMVALGTALLWFGWFGFK